MSAVVKAVSKVVDTVVDAVGDVVEVAVDVVEDVAETVGDVVETALDDPIRTIATVAAIAAGQPQLIPVINAADTLADGGSFEDALESAAISYVAQGVGSYVGDVAGTALEYGTDPLSQQTAMLAAQTGDMLSGTTSGTIGGALGAASAGATAAALSGGDADQAFINALGNYLVRTGVRYTVNEAGKLVDDFGREAPQSVVDEITADAENELVQLSGPTDESLMDLVTEQQAQDEFYQPQTYDETTDLTGLFTPETEPTLTDLVEEQQAQDPNYVAPTYDETTDLTEPTLTELVEEQQAQDPNYVAPTYDETTDLTELFAPPVDPTLMDLVTEQQEQDPNYVEPTYDETIDLTGLFTDPNLDPYEVDNVGTRDEEDILTGTTTAPDLSNLTNAAGSYLKNQFINSLTKQITGGLGFGPGAQTGSRRPFYGQPMPDFGIGSYLSSLGFDFLQTPEGAPFAQDTGKPMPIREWDPGIDLGWSPEAKLGGLGFAGRFINQDNENYVNEDEEQRQRVLDQVRARGWMTDEERMLLEPESSYFDVGNIGQTEDMSPYLNLGYAEGGLIDHNPEFFSEGGASLANRYVRGEGDGTSDSVPAMLAKGEFVFPADVVSGLGNGDNEAGAKVLDEFMKSVRQHKRAADPSELPPDSKGPLEYLAEAQKKVGKKHGRT